MGAQTKIQIVQKIFNHKGMRRMTGYCTCAAADRHPMPGKALLARESTRNWDYHRNLNDLTAVPTMT